MAVAYPGSAAGRVHVTSPNRSADLLAEPGVPLGPPSICWPSPGLLGDRGRPQVVRTEEVPQVGPFNTTGDHDPG
jgi:hypothetical protein